MTVVIPVWGPRYLEDLPRALSSVRAENKQTPIVVVDNASEPAVPERDDVKLVRSAKRLSAGAARNLGLDATETEYVVFLDADDELAPGALTGLVEGIEGAPEAAIFAFSLVEAGSGRRHRSPRRFVPALASSPRLLALLTSVWSLVPIQGNAIMRTAWVREAGGYADCDGGEDWVLAASQAFRGRVVLDPRPGLVYHARSGSLWRRTRGTGSLLAAACRVRVRLREDPAVPAWIRPALPLIAVAQATLIVAVRPVYRALRRLAAR